MARLDAGRAAGQTGRMVEWITAQGLTNYDDAVAFMEARVAAIHEGQAEELIWLVEHPPLYTAGTSARDGDLLDALEAWVIAALSDFGVTGVIRDGRVGVWVPRPDKPPLPDGSPRDDKIAAIGVKLRRWVSFHGIAINVEPDLSHYSVIVPCGISGHGVTSLVDLGLPVGLADMDLALRRNFDTVFG